MKIRFGKTIDIEYKSDGAYAKCIYDENEIFLNNLFDEIRRMPVSDDADNPVYFLIPILKENFKKFAYTDFIRFLKSEGMYSDAVVKSVITNKANYDKALRMASVICGYRFL